MRSAHKINYFMNHADDYTTDQAETLKECSAENDNLIITAVKLEGDLFEILARDFFGSVLAVKRTTKESNAIKAFNEMCADLL